MAQVDLIALEMGRRIADVRKRKGWTQLQLAEATGWNQGDADNENASGLSPSRIGNYEQGKRRISNEEALALAAALGTHPAYLLAVVDEQQERVLSAMEAGRDSRTTRAL